MRALLMALAVVLAAGCDSSDDDPLPADDPADGPLVVTLPARFDDLPDDEPVVPSFFVVETVGTYPCSNYELLVRTQATERGVTVEVEGVRAPELCERARGPARAQVDFPDGAGDGFEIFLPRPGISSRAYVLVLRDGRYELSESVVN